MYAWQHIELFSVHPRAMVGCEEKREKLLFMRNAKMTHFVKNLKRCYMLGIKDAFKTRRFQYERASKV